MERERPRNPLLTAVDDLVATARGVLSLRHRSGAAAGPTRTRRRAVKPDGKGRIALARQLASDGKPHAEIARHSGLSQDAVSMLLNLTVAQPAESAGQGTFFRALNERMRTGAGSARYI